MVNGSAGRENRLGCSAAIFDEQGQTFLRAAQTTGVVFAGRRMEP
jgi:hypothetical protein